MWNGPDDRRLYVRLLNCSIYKYAGHRDVRYDAEHKGFYFRAINPCQARTIQYKSIGGRKASRQVVWQPVRKSTGEARNYWWHVAAGLRFHEIAPLQWCFGIRPEWHLTRDGETPLTGRGVGRRVASRKSRMYNFQYLKEVNLRRDFLSGGSPDSFRGSTAEQIQDGFPSLRLREIYGAISYYLEHEGRISEYLRRREDEAQKVRAEVWLRSRIDHRALHCADACGSGTRN